MVYWSTISYGAYDWHYVRHNSAIYSAESKARARKSCQKGKLKHEPQVIEKEYKISVDISQIWPSVAVHNQSLEYVLISWWPCVAIGITLCTYARFLAESQIFVHVSNLLPQLIVFLPKILLTCIPAANLDSSSLVSPWIVWRQSKALRPKALAVPFPMVHRQPLTN